MARSKVLSGRTAVVTGGANGIGAGIALGLAEAGADVFFTSRADRPAAKAMKSALTEYGVRAEFMMLEAGDNGSVERLLDETELAFGLADVLVNNAAMTTRTGFLDLTVDEYERVMTVNLRFPFFLTQAFAQRLRDAGEQGSIINVSSISATKAISAMAHYQCSKAGLAMLTKGASYELAQYGIRVNSISPGLTATKSNRSQWQDDPGLWHERGKDIPLRRTGQPEDLAGAAVFLASDASSWMTGADIIVDGGEAAV